MTDYAEVADHLQSVLLFGVMAIILNRLAIKYHFFKLPESSRHRLPIQGKQVVIVFTVYLLLFFIGVPLIAKMLLTLHPGHPLALPFIARLQLLCLILSMLVLTAYLLSLDPHLLKKIWKDKPLASSSIIADVGYSFITWVLAFPLVIAVGDFFDFLLNVFFGEVHYEQVAVQFLKLALENPSILYIALFSIILAAPVIEELLFRGFLQNFLKRRVGLKASLLITSIAFALFHVAPSQGVGNLSLVTSLFVFSLYLGFLYEKRKSLYAPIALHALFNSISAIRIIFLAG